MKHPAVLLTATAILLALGWLLVKGSLSSDKAPRIAIFTTLSHPALTEVRTEFKTRISALMPDVKIVEFNAEGRLDHANLIAKSIADDDKILGTLAIGTLAAQAIAKVEKTRPIVVAAVTDPEVFSGLSSSNLCGLTDAINAEEQTNTLITLLPSLKKIALMFSPAEANSASMVKQIARSLDAHGIDKILVGVHDESQIMAASIHACEASDAVVIPLDNQLVAAMPLIIKATQSLNCAVVTSNAAPIHQGASIAFGVDYQKSGKDAAVLLEEILSSKRPIENIGFINPTKVDVFINDSVVKRKNIVLNADAHPHLTHVEENSDG